MRSDNVSNLNQAGVQAMWDYGVTTVIDLRSESEVAKFPSPNRATGTTSSEIRCTLLSEFHMRVS